MERNQGQMRYGMNARAYTASRPYQGRMTNQTCQQSMSRNDYQSTASGECRTCKQNEEKDEKRERFPIAMAYVPWQKFDTTYPVCKGFNVGTIFPDLDLPFERGRCQRK